MITVWDLEFIVGMVVMFAVTYFRVRRAVHKSDGDFEKRIKELKKWRK